MLEDTVVDKRNIRITLNFDKQYQQSNKTIEQIAQRELQEYLRRAQDTATDEGKTTSAGTRKKSESFSRTQSIPEQTKGSFDERSADAPIQNDPVEKLRHENEILKEKLKNEQQRCEFYRKEIEIENMPIGYDYNVTQENSGLKKVSGVLHDELIDFEKYISNIMEDQQNLVDMISQQVKTCVEEISPDLDV